MKTNKLKPFNLAEFKAGKPAITRGGRKAIFVACYEGKGKKKLTYPLVSFVKGEDYLVGHTLEGEAYTYDCSPTDLLFMAKDK